MIKFLTAYSCFALTSASIGVADIPSSIEPRKHTEKNEVEGSAWLIQPIPMDSNYLIITCPLNDNPEREYQTFLAKADTALKPDDIKKMLGKFVHIKATRIKNPQKGNPTLLITSIHVIQHWR